MGSDKPGVGFRCNGWLMRQEVPRMLARISDVPDSVLGFRASGELTGDDYRNVLVPAVQAALQSGGKLRLLYLLGDDVTGFTPGAAWQDTKVGMTHPTRWEKIAVVTDKEWLGRSVDIFGYLIPGEIRAFTAAEEADARAWIQS
jgi:hypothetical protein